MSWRTNSAVLWTRNVGRVLGVNRIVARLGERGYEEQYDEKLSSCIRNGDVVWDIGANVGYYTTQFASRVGSAGRVIAFEPSARNFQQLQSACKGLANVTLEPYGLGKTPGRVHFKQGCDALGATSQVVDDESAEDTVEIRVGDSLVLENAIPPPNAIKMDVEGFEGEVLEGLKSCLASPRLRAVGVEVHFGILHQRGLSHVPHDIEAALKAAQFSVIWPDQSHLLATR